ncbi:hypothetical protein FRB97_000396 [Tulasnella sp. 331]|nr:hypothetical protein FRB97_000396 [Tulasnella sp. 331]
MRPLRFPSVSLHALHGPKQSVGLRISILYPTSRAINTKARTIVVEGKTFPTDSHTNITPTIISKIPRKLHLTPAHPLNTLRHLIESSFPSFSALSSLSPLVTPAQNFDDLGFPLDHPGRSLTDSYYINKDMMLRTHTSAHEVETFKKGLEKWLLIADVYRRDEIDSSHHPVFHQVEGARTFDLTKPEGVKALEEENARMEAALTKSNIEIEDTTEVGVDNPFQATHDEYQAGLVMANLKHHLNGLILRLFGGVMAEGEGPLKVRWIPAYFPWTSPSYEVEVLFHGKWLEILGCGVVQNDTLVRSGVENRLAWAFGLGLERIAMVLFKVPDIRLFWSEDPRFLSQFEQGKITSFKPYSKYPPCWRDISLWVDVDAPRTRYDGVTEEPRPFHENDFCDVVRDTAGDLVENVELTDEFVHPTTGRKSVCYRINYRSMDKSLSNLEVNIMHGNVTKNLLDSFDRDWEEAIDLDLRTGPPRAALCSPRTTQCTGGWWSFAFSATSQRTITYGPAVANGVPPNATFTFNGTAVYYYGISSALTAAVQISLDGGTPAVVNLTQAYNLNFSSPINYPVLAWSAVNLDPTIQHTFFMAFDDFDQTLGKWAGFDSIVYTEPLSASSSAGSSTVYSASQTQVAVSTPAGTSGASTNSASSGSTTDPNQNSTQKSSHGAAIGGAIGGVIVVLIIIGLLLFFYCKRSRRNKGIGGGGGNGWDIDDTGRRNVVQEMAEAAAGRLGVGGRASSAELDPDTEVHTPFLTHGVTSPSMTSSTLPGTTAYDARSSMPVPRINPEDLQRPESIARILQQQEQILSHLQRQSAAGGSQTFSSPTTVPSPHPSTQVFEKNRPIVSATRPALPLPPGAAPPRPGSSPGTGETVGGLSPLSIPPEESQADLASSLPPPAYTAK